MGGGEPRRKGKGTGRGSGRSDWRLPPSQTDSRSCQPVAASARVPHLPGTSGTDSGTGQRFQPMGRGLRRALGRV
jgi:hypothetical protein